MPNRIANAPKRPAPINILSTPSTAPDPGEAEELLPPDVAVPPPDWVEFVVEFVVE